MRTLSGMIIILLLLTGCDDKLKPGEFEDEAFKACVQEKIDYDANLGILDKNDPELYNKIYMLACEGGGVRSIKGIENMPNIDWLAIVDNQLESLEPLRALTKLENLKLNNNKIKDLEPLSELPVLSALYLMDNYIIDVTPLYNCKKITALSINGNCITDEKQFEDLNTQLPNAGISGDSLAAQTPEKCQ